MLDRTSFDTPSAEKLLLLQQTIADALSEADHLQLGMVGIHLCNALHSLDDEMEQARS